MQDWLSQRHVLNVFYKGAEKLKWSVDRRLKISHEYGEGHLKVFICLSNAIDQHNWVITDNWMRSIVIINVDIIIIIIIIIIIHNGCWHSKHENQNQTMATMWATIACWQLIVNNNSNSCKSLICHSNHRQRKLYAFCWIFTQFDWFVDKASQTKSNKLIGHFLTLTKLLSVKQMA